jgi:peroxiredoxin
LTLEDIANMYKQARPMEGAALNTPLPVGKPAPDVALRDPNGQLVRLSDYRGKPVVLVFYPLDWSPGCSDQLSLYQSELAEFERRGAQILAISVDSIYSHGAWAAVRGLSFPLLADFHPKGEVARRYQVYREPDGFSERALYIIDGEGVIRYAHVSPQLNHVPDIYELFEALDAVAAPAAEALLGEGR